MENKLSSALADMEIELRKCSVDENGLVGLHHIFEQVRDIVRVLALQSVGLTIFTNLNINRNNLTET